MELNEIDETNDITRFLERFNQSSPSEEYAFPTNTDPAAAAPAAAESAEKYNQSFAKLEEKIQELEEKFAASTAQNQAMMQELARTRQAVENQKSKDAFFANIATTIANLKQSVENLSHVQPAVPVYTAPAVPRTFDAPATRGAADYLSLARDQWQQDLQQARQVQTNLQAQLLNEQAAASQLRTSLQAERVEKEQLLSEKTAHTLQMQQAQAQAADKARLLSSLQQKASQLKAVNSALDREIKRVQEERTEALRKSAEQAKEILSLRDALTAAEERFRSFDFKGRIISVKRHYEKKVSKLETQLREISNTCMRQVEEIESLKAENLKLHRLAEEREQLAVLYDAKTQELHDLQVTVQQLRADEDNLNESRLAAFTQRMQRLQGEHQTLAQRLTQAQQALQTVSEEKQTLEQNFKALLLKIEKNDAVIDSLKQKIAVLTEENRELKQNQTTVLQTKRTALPKDPVPVRQPAVKPTPVQHAEQKAAAMPEPSPVEMQNTLLAQVKTDADLPEIRVADPIPQPEVELGDDFLEKTDSFIGRMKWSIFREDK